MATDDEDDKLKDLNDTIKALILWRSDPELKFDAKMKITDRLIKALALKYKNSTDSRGSRFKPRPKPEGDPPK